MPQSQASQFRNRANVGLLALAFLVILVTSVVSVRSINALRESIGWVTHTMEVKDELARLQFALHDLEVAGLRFMIDGRAEHREALNSNLDQVAKGIQTLRTIASDNDEQRVLLDALVKDHERLRERARTSIAIKDADMARGDDRAAIRRLRDGRGERIVDRMRARIQQMMLIEDGLLAERQTERDVLVKQTNATLLVANGLALFAGLIGFLALRRAQREAENTLLLQLRAAQARRASEEKSVFLANMSHEIRTPMNAIFGFAQLLADHVDEPLQREWVTSIRKSGQVLLTLINDVLDLSKIEAGKLQLNPQGTDIGELVEETLSLFGALAEARDIALQLEIARDGLVPVAVDAPRLRQVLMNLISNAVKYTEHGTVTVSVDMAPSPLGGHDLRIRVQDTGTGIHPDEQARIFEPFYQADSPDGRSRQGTGLGLSVTRLLVQLMQGRIEVVSTPGEGALFQVDIPALPEAEAVAPNLADGFAEAVDFDRLPPLRILVVDDVDWNVEVARGYLRGSHHSLAIARDGEEAVAVARAFRPDVVLMDLRMPRMNGYRATEAIRADIAARGARIIAVTASSMTDDHGTTEVRFDGYVRKPYAPAELLSSLIALFGERSSAQGGTPPGDGVKDDNARDAVRGGARSAAAPPTPAEDRRAEALAEWATVRGAPLEALRTRMRMREIGEFSRRLDVLADAIGDPRLLDEARQLRRAVQRFDVNRMKAVLDRLAGHALALHTDDAHAHSREDTEEDDAQ
ncbi:ATP-binding protein [Lysobacter brunescens]|uniref:histidine kinase n=1 Tax=Lysobacter brunescens TaxID=262323 RepID=A0ABW2Y9A2_9GAMM